MESASYFWQPLKLPPDTPFAWLGLPTARAVAYQFEAIEVKKSQRHDVRQRENCLWTLSATSFDAIGEGFENLPEKRVGLHG